MSGKDIIEVIITEVGTDWKEAAVVTPLKYQVLRARAAIIGGSSPGTTVALKLLKLEATDSNIKPVDTVLEYSLSSEIDSPESEEMIIMLTKNRANTRTDQGLTYINVKTNGASTTVIVSIEIEILT